MLLLDIYTIIIRIYKNSKQRKEINNIYIQNLGKFKSYISIFNKIKRNLISLRWSWIFDNRRLNFRKIERSDCFLQIPHNNYRSFGNDWFEHHKVEEHRLIWHFWQLSFARRWFLFNLSSSRKVTSCIVVSLFFFPFELLHGSLKNLSEAENV